MRVDWKCSRMLFPDCGQALGGGGSWGYRVCWWEAELQNPVLSFPDIPTESERNRELP